ncbi:MAG: DUF86 domain-containing protein [Bacteroidetes bacterium]|jgi:uncharacterized protein with HEPN domain|nr:DUF86 domain-containing protein [Bacteroidota bacterium]
MKDETVYLYHIAEAIEQIESYTASVSRERFFTERMVQDAVVRQLEILGEASRQLSDEFRTKHDHIPWHAIIGMRNRIAHEYLALDLNVIWEVVKHDLPTLKSQIAHILT